MKIKTKTPYWTKIIEVAKRRAEKGKVAFKEQQIERAGNWVTCACGKQDSRLVRDYEGAPRDEKLTILGMDFYTAVDQQRPDEAEIILAKIERRAIQLLPKPKRVRKPKPQIDQELAADIKAAARKRVLA